MTLLLSHAPMDHPAFIDARWHDAKWTHHAVMNMFGDLGGGQDARATGNVLYRVEPDVAGGRVLIQSTVEPVAQGLRTRPLDQVFAALGSGSYVRFLLAANTVRTINRGREHDRAIRTHRAKVPASQLAGWLEDRLSDALDVDVLAPPETRTTRRGKAQLVITSFRGTATVTDPTRLREMAQGGVGRAKAYGCGLLSVLPVT